MSLLLALRPPLLSGSMPAAAAALCSNGSGTQVRTPHTDALLAAAAGTAMPHLHASEAANLSATLIHIKTLASHSLELPHALFKLAALSVDELSSGQHPCHRSNASTSLRSRCCSSL
jgi:hypothetical protein